jgi:hypothetical protein
MLNLSIYLPDRGHISPYFPSGFVRVSFGFSSGNCRRKPEASMRYNRMRVGGVIERKRGNKEIRLKRDYAFKT